MHLAADRNRNGVTSMPVVSASAGHKVFLRETREQNQVQCQAPGMTGPCSGGNVDNAQCQDLAHCDAP